MAGGRHRDLPVIIAYRTSPAAHMRRREEIVPKSSNAIRHAGGGVIGGVFGARCGSSAGFLTAVNRCH